MTPETALLLLPLIGIVGLGVGLVVYRMKRR
jgi:LPXTG-motif cell wall-anchored protein